MEFDLKQISRDWIEGVSRKVFLELFEAARSRLLAVPQELRGHGALLCERDPVQFTAVFFAAASVRFPVVLANPNWGEREWSEFRGLVSPVISFGLDPTAVHPDANSASSRIKSMAGATSEDLADSKLLEVGAILIPTGGSSGGVKLAIHDWASLALACEGVQSFLGDGTIDSCCVLPLYHVSGLMQLLRAYHSGGSIRFDEDEVAGRCLSYVPTQLQRAMADCGRVEELAKARAIFVGGAALPEGVAKKARELRLPVVPVYGMTETAAMVAAVPNREFLAESGPPAVALGEARFQIQADGRIRIHSPALFKGYCGRKPLDLSAGYVTDDAGHIDEDGGLHVIGRMDRLINSGGEKIDPQEVEAAFQGLDGVDDALAVGQPDKEWGQRLVVYYTGRRVDDWKTKLGGALAKHKLPKEVHWVKALPLDESTATG